MKFSYCSACLSLAIELERLQRLLLHDGCAVWHHRWLLHRLLGCIGDLGLLGVNGLLKARHVGFQALDGSLDARIIAGGYTVCCLACHGGKSCGDVRQAVLHLAICLFRCRHAVAMRTCFILDFVAVSFCLLEMRLEDVVVSYWQLPIRQVRLLVRRTIDTNQCSIRNLLRRNGLICFHSKGDGVFDLVP